jgi:hypothetical protein
MPLSDREVKNVLSFYVDLRNVVLVVGAAVMVAGFVALIAVVYEIGRKDGGHAAAASSSPDGQTAPKPKPRVRAKPQEDIDALERQEAEGAAVEEGGAEPAGSGAETDVETETAPETGPDPLEVQSSGAAANTPTPVGGSVSAPPGDGESPHKETHNPSSENGLTKRLKQVFREPKQN